MPDGGIGEDFLHVAGLVQVLSGNGSMRPFLLVGIENTERRRDMTGPSKDPQDQKIAPRIGAPALPDHRRARADRRVAGWPVRGRDAAAGTDAVQQLHRARPQPVVEPGNDAGGCSQAAAGSDACAAARVPGQQRAAGAGSLCRAAGNAAGAALAVAAGEVPATAGGNPRHDLSSGRIAGAAHAVPGTAAGLALTALAPRCAPCKDAAAAPSGAPTATGAEGKRGHRCAGRGAAGYRSAARARSGRPRLSGLGGVAGRLRRTSGEALPGAVRDRRAVQLPAGAQRAQHVGAEGRQPGGFHPGRAASAGRPDLEAEPLAGLHAQRPGAHRSA
ncbi:hypothetical protein G6F35_011776 [Rhizopus arrhizus]|nr:hypothetical protein G6F35_011776 [Rhizopus arrhizus]